MEKNPWRYYHFTNINDSHMVYGFSDMECNGQNFVSFWTIFCNFTPLQPEKSKFEKMKKTCRDIIILHMCTINYNHMMYGSWDMERVTDRIFVILDHFLPFYLPPPPHWQPRKSKFSKNEKIFWRYHHFTHV